MDRFMGLEMKGRQKFRIDHWIGIWSIGVNVSIH